MALRAYTASDVTLRVYRFDIPASPVGGGNGTCRVVNPSRLVGWTNNGQDPEGLTVVDGKVAAISEDDGVIGRYSDGLNTPLPGVDNITNFRRTSSRFGTEAALAYNGRTRTLYNLQADDLGSPTKSTLYVKGLPLGGNGSLINFTARRPQPKYADGLGVNDNGLLLASSARNISATNPAGIYQVNPATGVLTLRANLNSSLGALNEDTGADFVPGGANGTFYILAEGGNFYRYTFTSATGSGGRLTKLCKANLKAQPGEAEADFEGLATINETIASNPDAPFTFASINTTDLGLAAPIAAGIVIGGLGALAKKLYK